MKKKSASGMLHITLISIEHINTNNYDILLQYSSDYPR